MSAPAPKDSVEQLHACLEAIEAGRGVEEALRQFPEARDELLPLLATARLVRSRRPRPAEAWRSDMARRWEQGLEDRAPITVQPRRWVVRVAAMAAAVVLALGGLVVASADSAPGDRLYPIRRGVERAVEVAGAVVGRSDPAPTATMEAESATRSDGVSRVESRLPREAPDAQRSPRDRAAVESSAPRVRVTTTAGTDRPAARAAGADRDPWIGATPSVPSTAIDDGFDVDAPAEIEDEARGEQDPAGGAGAADPPARAGAPAQSPVPDRGAEPERPPPPAPPAGGEPPDAAAPPSGPGALPPAPPSLMPIASATPRSVGLAPVGPAPGVLPATGSISGRALDKRGEPMARALISVYRAADRYGFSRRGPRPIAVVRTESDGRYQVEGLLPDSYVVAVRNPGFFAGETYHPDAPDRWRAEAVEVESGRDTGGVDIRQPERRWIDPFVDGRSACRGVAATDC